MRIRRPPLLRVLVDAATLRASSQKAASLILGLLLMAVAVMPVSAATISGTVAYSGGQTGMIVVTASSSPTGIPVVATTQLASPGAFTLTNLSAPASYWLFAYRDSNANGTNDSPEARTYSTNALTLTSDLSGATLTLLNPDNDGDGLPDWWEIKYGFDPFRNDSLGSGRDGDLSVVAGQTNYSDTVRTTLSFSPTFGTTELLVAATNGFSSNDLVLIIAIQDANTNFLQNVAGVFDFKRVTGVGSNRLFVATSLDLRLRAASQAKIQVLRIPEYRSVSVNGTLTCSAWDGTNGGIVAFLCQGTVVVGSNGRIQADAKGYRGGFASSDYRYNGVAGEGTRTAGFFGNPTRIENLQGGGGVSAIGLDAVGAGGGSYGTSGLDGHDDNQAGYQGKGALAYGTNTLERLLLGGGGGGCIYSGGSGGGVVFIAAQAVQGSGSISSSGDRGQRNAGVGFGFNSAASGSGAGGSIYISGIVASSVQVSAQGGQGPQIPNTPTGQGGDGRIRFDLPAGQALPTSSPAPGFVGQANAIGAFYVFAPDSDQDGFSDYEEFLSGSNPRVQDSDGDGLPDWWEVQFGINPNNAADALTSPQGDRLTYLSKFQFGLHPTTVDTDGDGLSDYDEIFVHGTNPLSVDTDGDGIPDGVEVQYGLNPRLNDANESKSFDGVTNLQKHQWNQAHTNAWEQMYPNRAFSGTNTVSDYERFNGIRTSRPVYDRNDRLIGVDYSSGVSLAFGYDGNGNLVRQKWISRASETNGLPALFTLLNNLTNSIGTSPYDDPDGDGWTNLQEQQAGTNPTDPLSKPDTAFNPGTSIASLKLPFIPTNFVMAVGQLDGLGAEEIVIGADGNPGTNANFILILTESYNGWATQRVDVGSFGVTSISVGQPTNRNPGSIYLGLRQTGGTGRILELVQTNGAWQPNVIAASTSQAAFVLGVRAANDVLASLANNGLDGALYSLVFTTNGNLWNTSVVSTNSSHRGLGTRGLVPSRTLKDASLRLLDAGGIEVIASQLEIVVNGSVIPNTASFYSPANKWYFQTSNRMTWDAAEAFFVSLGGHLVTLSSAEENNWTRTNFLSDWVQFPNDNRWIGIYYVIPFLQEGNTSSHWKSGSSSTYRNFPATTFMGFDNLPRNGFNASMSGGNNGYWNAELSDSSRLAIGEFQGSVEIFTNRWRLPELAIVPDVAPAPGASLSSGFIRPGQSNTVSIFYGFVDTKLSSGLLNPTKDFVVVEFEIQTNGWRTNMITRVPIEADSATAYGLSVAQLTLDGSRTLFTAEPGGLLFAWPATNSTDPLQRRIFSSYHKGKSWHAVAGVKLAEPGEGLAGLRVDPTNPSVCTVTFFPPQPTFGSPPSIPQTAPSTLILPSPNTGGSLSQIAFRLWDNEGNASLPMLEFQVPSSTTWSNATVLSVDGQALGRVAALPTGSDHILVWNAGRDLGAGFTNIVLLRARASDVTVTGDYSATVSYRVELSAGNPVANPDSTNTLQAVPVDINVLANDTVQSGLIPSVLTHTQPANGVAALNANQTIRYTPRTNFLGTDSFTYTLSDGTGGTNIAVVTITVAPVNHSPTPHSYTLSTAEEAAVTFLWSNYLDADGDLVTLQSVRSPSAAGGTVTMQAGAITYTPATNFFGTDTFTFIVQDNGRTVGVLDPKQATNTVTVTVTPVNDPPTITLPTPVAIVQNTSLRFADSNTITVSDVDAGPSAIQLQLTVANGSLTFGITNGLIFVSSTNGTTNLTVQATLTVLNSALTNLTWQPTSNFFGADALRMVANDLGNTGIGGALTANASLPLFVAQQSIIAPLIATQPQGQTVGAGSSVAFGVVVTGTAPISYQWQLSGTNLPGATNSVLTITNILMLNAGNYRVQVSNAAATVISDVAALTVLIPVTNSPPALTAVADRSVVEGSTLVITIQATDTDQPAQALTFSLPGAPAGATINPTNGVFTWTPTEFQGPSTNTITVLVTDNGTPPMMAVGSFRVEVLESNAAPTLALGNMNVVEGNTLVLSGYASDVDWPPNILTYSLLSVNPGGLTLNATNGVITWTPTEAQGPGSYSVTVRVADNGIPSLSATQMFTVNVTEANSPPVLGFIPNQTVYQGETVVIPVAAVDSDLPANQLTFTLLSAPTNASFTNNTFVWRPTAVQADAIYPVGIVVTDNGLPPLSATQTFQITVNRLAQLSAQSLGANRVSINVSGRSNVIYTLEASTNLLFWQTVLVTNSAAAVFEVIESTSPTGLRIYRIREQRQY